ncbi:DUF7289 family protein [Natrinema salaciae]|uniref:Uncharacterized protein n=1 Tax=Natrinema salaciae TaxID=1186196 RepID=A0A1H9FZP8_9EURY|nr:hypothetical protein [Natrinema salaciae]SEQ42938.1 hypothetical protein SAMN04489841_1717 [Natrinema salaciae]
MRRTRPRPGPATQGRRRDRAVSDVLAFILVFAIILSSVAILSTFGLQAMTDYQENEQLRNAERAMEALTVNFNDVVRSDGIDQRYGELALREGTVRTNDTGTQLNISIDGVGGGDPIGTTGSGEFDGYGNGTTADLGEFTYTAEGSQIAYEGGGLVRKEQSASWSRVLKRPQLRCNDETAVVSLVVVSSDYGSIQSSDGLGFTMSVENRSSAVYTGADSVSIAVVDSPYEEAWQSTLESGDWSWDGSTDTGTCDVGSSGRVVVTLVEVDIDY